MDFMAYVDCMPRIYTSSVDENFYKGITPKIWDHTFTYTGFHSIELKDTPSTCEPKRVYIINKLSSGLRVMQ